MKTLCAFGSLLFFLALSAPSRACLPGEVECSSTGACCAGDCCSNGPCPEEPSFHYYCVKGYNCVTFKGDGYCEEIAVGPPQQPKVLAQRSPVDDDAPRSCALGHGGGTAGSFALLAAAAGLAFARRRRRLGR